MVSLATCGLPLEWHNCYSGQIDIWHLSAYSHPAKMSPALCFRIFEHLEELDLLRPGQIILDPLAGIGTTGLVAALKGYPSILIELEDKFVKLAQANADHIALKGFGASITIIQGDARHLSQLLRERGLIGVTSPPYQTGTGEGHSLDPLQTGKGTVRGRGFTSKGPTYASDTGSTPGQIGNLPDKLIAVSSPPYGDTTDRGKQDNEFLAKAGEKHHRLYTPASFKDEGYGSTPGQIGSLPDKPIAITPTLTNNSDRYILEPREANDEAKAKRTAFNKTQEAEGDVSIISTHRTILGSRDEPTQDSGISGYRTSKGSQSNEGLQHPNSSSRGTRPQGKEGLQGWKPKPSLALPDREGVAKQGEMPTMREQGQVGNTPQGFRPLQQQPEQSSSVLPSLPSEPSQDLQSQGDKEQRADRLGTSPQGHFVTLTSPPWNLQSGGRGEASRQATPDKGLIDRHGGGIKGGSGDSPGNIGTLPDRPLTAITSPPYEDMDIVAGRQTVRSQGISRLYDPLIGPRLGKSEGQIGQEQGQTYLEAMALVYAEIAKVADVLVCVVKNPTRNGKLRRLDLDTIALLEATGWQIKCRHRAILFEEQEMGHLFEGQVKKPRGRLSFFKRLQYQKGKSEIAMWEDVLVAVKRGAGGLCAITSPPYGNPRDTSEEYDDLYDLRCPPGVKWGRESFRGRYGDSSGQIGKLKDK